MNIWRIVDRMVLHIFDMVAGIKLMPMTLMLNKGVMSPRVFGAASFQISDRFCYAGIVKTTSSPKVKGRVPRAKKMNPGKSGGKGKGKAISKGYQLNHHIQSLFKGAVGKDKGFSDIGKTRLGKVATDIDARQSASGLKVAEESLPGELGRALEALELMKLG
eukprot:s4707_g6.t1